MAMEIMDQITETEVVNDVVENTTDVANKVIETVNAHLEFSPKLAAVGVGVAATGYLVGSAIKNYGGKLCDKIADKLDEHKIKREEKKAERAAKLEEAKAKKAAKSEDQNQKSEAKTDDKKK